MSAGWRKHIDALPTYTDEEIDAMSEEDARKAAFEKLRAEFLAYLGMLNGTALGAVIIFWDDTDNALQILSSREPDVTRAVLTAASTPGDMPVTRITPDGQLINVEQPGPAKGH